MLEYTGVGLKLGSKKVTRCWKILFPSAYIAGKGGDTGTTQTHQESWQHGHDTDCFNSVERVTLRNWPTLANTLIQAIISLFCR